MSLTSVMMSEEVWLTCLTHALTTETEEIMGLLLGDIQHRHDGSPVALIWGASPQMRCDRRKDRVETNPEQLAAASAEAERMTNSTGRLTRVIGWYHSHPHITVLPSHVDVRTQAMYQLLDPGFVGLIFSCYSEDAQKVGKIQVIAFQSLDGRQKNVPAINNSSIIELETSNSSSNILSPSTYSLDRHNGDTADSRMAKTAKVGEISSNFGDTYRSDTNYLGRERVKETSLIAYKAGDFQNVSTDTDSTDMSASMQEALHRSNMDISGAEYTRKEIPLHVLPSMCLLNHDSPLKSFVDMQHVLFEEERSAYGQSISQNSQNGKIHPLSFIHHTSTYQASLCKLMEHCLTPAIAALQDCLRENEIRLHMLNEEAKFLEKEASSRNANPNKESPRRSSSMTHRSASFGQRVSQSADSSGPSNPQAATSRSRRSS